MELHGWNFLVHYLEIGRCLIAWMEYKSETLFTLWVLSSGNCILSLLLQFMSIFCQQIFYWTPIINYHTHFYLQILLALCLLYKCIFKQRWLISYKLNLQILFQNLGIKVLFTLTLKIRYPRPLYSSNCNNQELMGRSTFGFW